MYGVAKNVLLHSVTVLDCTGAGSTSSILGGLNFIVLNASRPAIISMSLGQHSPLAAAAPSSCRNSLSCK